MYKRIILIFVLCLFCHSIAKANESTGITVSGYVFDAVSNEALIATNIQIRESDKGTTTDGIGFFSLTLPAPGILKFSYIGYKVKFVEIKKNSDNLIIKMTPSAVFLNSIVIYPNTPDIEKIAGVNNLNPQDLKKVSGVFQDALVAMKTLPGVSSRSNMEARYSVRGGNPDENLVMVNNTTVYSPFHLKWNKYGMSVGIFNLDLVESVQLSSGGFGAKYGDKLSSLLLLNYREGNHKKVHGKALLTLPDSRLILEGPITSKMNFIFGARLFQFAYIMKGAGIAPDNFNLNYWDVHSRLVYRPKDGNKISLLYIRSGDEYLLDDEVDPQSVYNYSGYVFNERYDNITQADTSFVDKESYFKTELLSVDWENITSSRNLYRCKVAYYNELNDDSDRNDYFKSSKFGDNYFRKKRYYNDYTINLNIENYDFFIEDNL